LVEAVHPGYSAVPEAQPPASLPSSSGGKSQATPENSSAPQAEAR